MRMAAFFVTGTDTGVGKTLVTVALLGAAAARGLATIALKPVAAGCTTAGGRPVNDDALALQAAATVRLDYALVNPVALRLGVAPHLAAAEEGLRLGVEPLLHACREAARAPHDLAVAEGAGGWLVPLNEHETMADLAAALGWPVILVVGMRLGCLNHALLTAAAVRASGLTLAGWVANSAGPPMPALAGNIATLEAQLGAPRLGSLPYLGPRSDPAAAVPHLDLEPLRLGDARV
jgi:dethiobiotin synthetase